MNAYSPQQAIELCSRAGVVKGNMRPDKVFFSAVMAGLQLAVACATLLSCETAPWFQANAPGLIRVIAAAFFPYGLVMIVLSGTDLTTTSFMFTTLAFVHRRLHVLKMLRHWALTFLGNLCGSLFMVAIIIGYGGVFDMEPYRQEVIEYATMKQLDAKWYQVFLRGIGANFLVCTACFLGMSGRDYGSKLVGIWWPTFGFVSLAFDHVVANMFFIPAAIWQHAPGITVGKYIGSGMVPACLGNIVGGGLFVGVWFWYLHISSEPAILIDGYEYMPAGVEVSTINGEVLTNPHSGTVNEKLKTFHNGFNLRKAKVEDPEAAAGQHHGG